MRRLGNIFSKDKKTVIVAMDHGLGLDVYPAMKNTGEILSAVSEAGADAFLTGYGLARRYQEELKGKGLILRVDGGNSALSDFQTGNQILDPEAALKEGADCLRVWDSPGLLMKLRLSGLFLKCHPNLMSGDCRFLLKCSPADSDRNLPK